MSIKSWLESALCPARVLELGREVGLLLCGLWQTVVDVWYLGLFSTLVVHRQA